MFTVKPKVTLSLTRLPENIPETYERLSNENMYNHNKK